MKSYAAITKELNEILEQVKKKIANDSDMVWTRYANSKQLRDELELYIRQLQNGDTGSLEKIKFMFLPTATLQEHSISNGWVDEYLKLAEKFDNLYAIVSRS